MTAPVVVALDYPGRRDDARMVDLLGDDPAFDVRHVLNRPPREVTAAAYAARLVERLDPDRPVAAVLAYCLASGIGQQVAALVPPALAVPPPLVLFDAGMCGFEVVEEAYGEVRAQFTVPDGAEPRGPSDGRPAWLTVEALRDRPADVVRSMNRELTRLACVEMIADGIDAEEAELTAEALVGHYLDWLIHLVAGHHATFPEWGGDVLHIVSAESTLAGEPWPGAASTHLIRLDCAHADLLRDPVARSAMLEHVRPLVIR